MSVFFRQLCLSLSIWALVVVTGGEYLSAQTNRISLMGLLTLFWGAFFLMPLLISRQKEQWGLFVLAATVGSVKMFVFPVHPPAFLLFFLVAGLGLSWQSVSGQRLWPFVLSLVAAASVILSGFSPPGQIAGLGVVIGGLAGVLLVQQEKEGRLTCRTLLEEAFARLRETNRQILAQETQIRQEERTRMARDMHDSVGHQLTALLMHLETLYRQIEPVQPEMLSQARDMAGGALEKTRFAVRRLADDQPPTGMAAVLSLVRKLEAQSHFRVELSTGGGILSAPLTNTQNVAIYRFVQEGLTNAMRHGRSREVTLSLSLQAGSQVVLTMENRVQNQTPVVPGFGLTGMNRRIEDIGGQMSWEQRAGHFLLEARFPLKEVGDHETDSAGR